MLGIQIIFTLFGLSHCQEETIMAQTSGTGMVGFAQFTVEGEP
jgi:hypothetical protein